jgi:enamine deaminase RidA (YjgF/YER057c/UK114 family)
MAKTRALNPWTWQDVYGFSQAVEAQGISRLLVCSGQSSVGAQGEPLHKGDMVAQLNQAYDNLEAVLVAGGYGFGDVVRLNYYTTDVPAYLAAAGEITPRFAATGRCPPAGTLLGVAALFHPDLLIEIEATVLA